MNARNNKKRIKAKKEEATPLPVFLEVLSYANKIKKENNDATTKAQDTASHLSKLLRYLPKSQIS